MMAGVRLSVAAVALLVLSSCGFHAFHTTDVYRPLVVAEFPKDEQVERLHREYFPQVDFAAFEDSVRLTRAAWNYFDIQKHQSFYADLDIERLAKALAAHPENPFAWTQLGAYLALQHRPRAAAEATREAITILEGLEDLSRSQELAELEWVSRINLAIYSNTAGQPEAALEALSGLGSPDRLHPFHRLAFYWAAAQAHTARSQVDASREALDRARRVADAGLGGYAAEGDYPQYFEPRKRTALFRYFEAANLRAEGEYDQARAELEAATSGPRGSSDPKLWDARFLRGLVCQEMGSLDCAHSEFDRLATDVPVKLFRREVVLYHLAMVELERGDLGDARSSLARSVELVRHGDRSLARDLERVLAAHELPDAVARVLDSAREGIGWHFPPAFESLGRAYLAAASEASGRANPARVAEARRMFEVALGERGFPDVERDPRAGPRVRDGRSGGILKPSVADALSEGAASGSPISPRAVPGAGTYARRHAVLAELARLDWQAGEPWRALWRYAEALGHHPSDRRILIDLVRLGSRAPEDEVSRAAYGVVLETLPLATAPFGVEPAAGREFAGVLSQTPSGEGSDELEHLRARLSLLQGAFEEAEAAFREAGSRSPEALWPVTGLAWTELAQGREVDSAVRTHLDRRLDLLPAGTPTWQVRDAHFVRGEVRLAAGDDQGALADFRRVAELAPRWTVAEEGIMVAEAAAGDG